MSSDSSYNSPGVGPLLEGGADPRARRDWESYSLQYNSALRSGLIIQGVLAVLTALVLDGGQMHRAFWVAFVGQWAAVWMFLFRRPIRSDAN